MKTLFALLWLLCSTTLFAQWERMDVATTASLRGLSAVGNEVVWASGAQGTVIRTVDGGKTWSVMTVPGAEKLDFRGIHAFDKDTAYIMSAGEAEKGNARIFRTQDGGKNWSHVFDDKTKGIFFDTIAFWGHQHGIVLSDPVAGHFVLFTTDDGGENWNRLPSTGMPPALDKEGAFAASNSCLTIYGSKDVWFGTGGAPLARVFHSHDRGKTWEVTDTPMQLANASSGIFSIAMRDAKHGLAVGGDYAHPVDSTLINVMKTEDGGKTWQAAATTLPVGRFFSAVAFDHSGDTIVSGITGIVSGSAWKQVSDQNIQAVSGNGWAVGAKGVVLHLKH